MGRRVLSERETAALREINKYLLAEGFIEDTGLMRNEQKVYRITQEGLDHLGDLVEEGQRERGA